jgi:ribonuclease/clavin/mitogillin
LGKPITVRCSGTNLYLIDCVRGKLLLDSGWPHCLPTLKNQVKTSGLKFSDIRYVMMTHAHPDHAGLTQTVKRLCGAQLVIHEKQVPFLQELNAFFERKHDADFEPIRVEKGDLVLKSSNRAVLQSIGIQGELVETPGHSQDSLSLVVDEGYAFVGDLTRPDLATEENTLALYTSWKTIIRMQIDWIYPGHGEPIKASDIEKLLENE